MTRWIAALGLVGTVWTAPVSAQAPGSSVAFVFDAGGARISGEAVRRAVASGLHRSVVRLADDGAHSATATLTMAFDGTGAWVLDVARGERHVRRSVRLRNGSIEAVAGLGVALVRDTEPTAEWVTVVVDDAILDPFGETTRVPQRMPMIDEIVDPFTTPPVAPHYASVVDPWQR